MAKRLPGPGQPVIRRRSCTPEKQYSKVDMIADLMKQTGYTKQSLQIVVDQLFQNYVDKLSDKHQIILPQLGYIIPFVQQKRWARAVGKVKGEVTKQIEVPARFTIKYFPTVSVKTAMRSLEISPEEIEQSRAM